jgi:glutathione peroxidase
MLVLFGVGAMIVSATETPGPDTLKFKMKDIDGKEVDLSQYQGKVVLIVNVASYCGYTKHYTGLEKIYEKYKDQGFVILGFPCNQFGNQEPGNEAAIKEFCTSKYNVTFPMFSKIEVNGDGTCPLYKTLKADAPTKGDVKWNFEKFLIAKDGKIAKRFGTKVDPESPEVTAAIETELKK